MKTAIKTVSKSRMRKALDKLYLLCGGISAFALVALLAIIIFQMATRWFGISVPGLTSYAGYCMAASLFFSLGYAFSQGSHIRVSLFLRGLGRGRYFVDIWCIGISAVITVFLSYYAIKTTWWSYQLGEISQAQDAVLIWIPQLAMSAGTVVLTIAVIDHFVQVVFGDAGSAKTVAKTAGEE